VECTTDDAPHGYVLLQGITSFDTTASIASYQGTHDETDEDDGYSSEHEAKSAAKEGMFSCLDRASEGFDPKHSAEWELQGLELVHCVKGYLHECHDM